MICKPKSICNLWRYHDLSNERKNKRRLAIGISFNQVFDIKRARSDLYIISAKFNIDFKLKKEKETNKAETFILSIRMNA